MSNITVELARMRAATKSPTLRLLRMKRAPFVLAVFREVFDQSVKSVKADRVHVRVDAFLAEAREAGYDVPLGDGRSLCTRWMNARWINRVNDDDDDEAYELTSAALGAQRVVESLTADRALLSESRLTMIVDGARRLALDANPDREARITALDKEIAATVQPVVDKPFVVFHDAYQYFESRYKVRSEVAGGSGCPGLGMGLERPI